MSLAEAIERARGLLALNSHALREPKLTATAGALAEQFEGLGAAPPAETIEMVAARFREAFRDGHLDRFSRRDWRLLPWALWTGQPSLAVERIVLDTYAQRLRQQRRRPEVRGLISAYVQSFEPTRPGIRPMGRLLGDLVELWNWPWRERHRRHQIFDPADGPNGIWQHCRGHEAGPRCALDDLGIGGYPHLGLPYHGYLCGLEALRGAFTEGAGAAAILETMLTWAVQPHDGVLGRVPLAEALLLPWTDRAPAPDMHERIQTFLLQHYGDPRVRIRSWDGVSEDAKAVFRRWMVKIALDQFLDVIDQLALERHWRYRRAFWSAYFENGLIAEAHVMFAPKGYRLARGRFGQEVPCARLESGGRKHVEPNHAVLLMRIGRLVIADWSHNGQCVIWNERHPVAPKLDRIVYTSADVDWSRADFNVVHRSSENYLWQRQVRDYIESRTGIRLSDAEFRIKGR